jgi:hypothetical protein
MFKGLTSLKNLDIRKFKSLRVIEFGAFKHLSNTLESLSVWATSLESIEPGALKCLSKLEGLGLRNNKLTDEQLAGLITNGELHSASSIKEIT